MGAFATRGLSCKKFAFILLTDPTAPLGNASYQFDQKNRLTAAMNTKHSAGYTYDPFNRRAGKTVDGVGTVFVDDGTREIADYDTTGHELARFVYGLDAAQWSRSQRAPPGLPATPGITTSTRSAPRWPSPIRFAPDCKAF